MYLQIKDLDFSYKNSRELVLNKINMEIEKGEVVAIIGESGSGKSTLLRLIAGLEEPEGGEIMINNKIMVNHRVFIEPENRGVGMLFQDYALFPHITVAGNVKFGLKGYSKEEKERMVQDVLKLVNLSGFEKRYPHELSGGQQQRVALARAIAPNPSLLLLDEPFSNLDANLKEKIRKEIGEIIKKANITSLIVTHDKEDAKVLADRMIDIK